jgi:hypothetical protein
MKTLVLKPRMPDDKGEPQWHDYFIVSNALAAIARGKSYMKMAMWIKAAGKIQTAMEEKSKGSTGRILVEISVALREVEASLLWSELLKLSAENFGGPHPITGQQQVPPIGTLQLMMEDFAKQLGEKLPEIEEENADPGDRSLQR